MMKRGKCERIVAAVFGSLLAVMGGLFLRAAGLPGRSHVHWLLAIGAVLLLIGLSLLALAVFNIDLPVRR
ncbi:MAG: hypothetical protein ACYTF6_13610, partial [Planctomycetota bacterium]